MALRTIVKVNAIKNLSDARYCAGMMVDYLGFCFDPALPDYVTPSEFAEIASWTSGVDLVAELGSLPLNDSLNFLERYPLSVVESDQIEVLLRAKEQGKKTILKWREGHAISSFVPDICLVSDLKAIPHTNFKTTQWIYNSSIRVEEVDQVLSLGWHGIALKGGTEIKPGLSQYGVLMDILEYLEIE